MSDDTREIRNLLLQDFEAIAKQLCPGGIVEGRHYKPLNPTRADRHPGSFVIDISGPTKGRWTEFAVSGHAGKQYLSGDPIDLIAYIEYGGPDKISRGKAFDWARSRYGMKRGKAPDPARRDALKIEAEKRAKDAEQERDRDRMQRAKAAREWWVKEKSKPDREILNSLGDTYLQTRGIHLSRLPRQPRAILCVPRLKHKTGTYWPGLLTAMCRWGEGRICAVHRTFLTAEGKKAPLDDDRMMFGDVPGAVMRLWKGPYERQGSLEKAFKSTGELASLMIHEGLEDGLSWVMARQERVHWSAGSLGNLSAIEWPEFADEVTVVFDRDVRIVDGLSGEDLIKAEKYNEARANDRNKVIERFQDQSKGRVFKHLIPRESKDSNDVWRAANGR